MSTYFTRLMITVRIVRRNMIPSYKYAQKTQATVYQDNYHSQHEIKQNVLIALSRMLCFLKSPRQHST